jgi:hypothetical protein
MGGERRDPHRSLAARAPVLWLRGQKAVSGAESADAQHGVLYEYGVCEAGAPQVNRILFSSASEHWATPRETFLALHREFVFTLDPCRINAQVDGLTRSWVGERIYCNPPYGRGIGEWLKKAREADLAVFLLPARTDTKWWHEYAMKADEIRFLRGRLKFGDSKNSAPFPSVILVYRAPSAAQPRDEEGKK